MQDLEGQLTSKTYLVSNYFTAADVSLYGALHPIVVSAAAMLTLTADGVTKRSRTVAITTRAILCTAVDYPLL